MYIFNPYIDINLLIHSTNKLKFYLQSYIDS